MCSSNRDLLAQRVVLLDLFYHCRGCPVTGMPSLIGLSWEKEYPSLTVRACDGLRWDTPAVGGLVRHMPTDGLSWAKLGHPCSVLSFESRARGYVADGNLLMSGCR